MQQHDFQQRTVAMSSVGLNTKTKRNSRYGLGSMSRIMMLASVLLLSVVTIDAKSNTISTGTTPNSIGTTTGAYNSLVESTSNNTNVPIDGPVSTAAKDLLQIHGGSKVKRALRRRSNFDLQHSQRMPKSLHDLTIEQTSEVQNAPRSPAFITQSQQVSPPPQHLSPSTDISRTTSTAAPETQEQDGLSRTAIVFMGLLALQFGLQPILVRRFTPQGINKSSVVLVQEMIKFVIAGACFHLQTGQHEKRTALAGWSVKSWLAVAGIPAALYTIQNIASLLAYQNLEALTFNVLNQTKILSAALCCYLVMGKKQSKVQVFSLLMLVASAMVMEKVIPLKNWGIAAAKSSLGSPDLMSRHVTHGVVPVLFASFISGLAGALTQKNLQGASKKASSVTKGRNTYLFSMEMTVASALVLLVSLLVSSDGKAMSQNGLLHKWTPQTLIPIFTNSIGGILVGLVTKHAGSVRKGFALIFGLLLSGVIQAGSSNGVSTAQIVGGLLAACSLWLHTTNPYRKP
jgi:UDP-sugar transporter A1/2/3